MSIIFIVGWNGNYGDLRSGLMSVAKMSRFIDIVSTEPVKDSEGFATQVDTSVAKIRAYKEERHGTERWANMAVFSTATTMFKFRRIPDVVVDEKMIIICDGIRYHIVSVNNIRNMYVEALAERIEGSVM
jgi:head-tail adaptor